MQLVRKRLRHERGVIDALGRRIELGGHDEIEGHGSLVEQSPFATTRQQMGKRAQWTEAGGDIRCRQRGELAERAHTEAGEQIDELVELEIGLDDGKHRRGNGSEERFGLSRCHNAHLCFTAQRRELGGESRVGDTYHRGAGDIGSAAEGLGCKCNDPLGQRVISPEVSRGTAGCEREAPRAGQLDAWRQVVEGDRHRLEGAGITSRIGCNHDEPRTTRLRFPAPQPDLDCLAARSGRRGDNTVRVDDCERLIGLGSSRHH